MTDIIPPENKELLAHILRGAEEQIAHVVNVQEKVAQLRKRPLNTPYEFIL